MISKMITDIIAEIGENDRLTKLLYGNAEGHRKDQEVYRKWAEEAEVKARESEAKLELLQLKLREALNKEPSSVPVEPPKDPATANDQIKIQELKDNVTSYQARITEKETKMVELKEELLKSLWNSILARDPNQTTIDEPVVSQILNSEQIGRVE